MRSLGIMNARHVDEFAIELVEDVTSNLEPSGFLWTRRKALACLLKKRLFRPGRPKS